MSSNNGPFGIDPEEFDRVVREAGEGLREALDGLGRFMMTSGPRTGWSTVLGDFVGGPRPRPHPETTGEAGDGVWAIYTVGETGSARIEQVFPTELDALRAHKTNTDPARGVRFLPYGIAVSVLDATPGTTGSPDSGTAP